MTSQIKHEIHGKPGNDGVSLTVSANLVHRNDQGHRTLHWEGITAKGEMRGPKGRNASK